MSSLPTSNLSLPSFAQSAQDVPDGEWHKCIVNICNFIIHVTIICSVYSYMFPYESGVCHCVSTISVRTSIYFERPSLCTVSVSHPYNPKYVFYIICTDIRVGQNDPGTGRWGSVVGRLEKNSCFLLLICVRHATYARVVRECLLNTWAARVLSHSCYARRRAGSRNRLYQPIDDFCVPMTINPRARFS